MSLYYILWAISLLIIAFPCSTKKGYRIELFLCFLLLFLFGAYRVDFGLDYAGYENLFNKSHSGKEFIYDPSYHAEIGYQFLNFICPSFRSLLILTSLLLAISYFFVFDKYVPQRYRFLAIFLLYLCGNNTIFFMLSGIRNSIAICILLLSAPFIIRRKLVYYIAMMFLAASFHTSAFIVFPAAYLIGLLNLNKRKAYNILILIALVLIFIPMNLLLELSSGFINTYFDRYNSYVNYAEEIGRGASLLVILSNLILIISINFSIKNKVLPRKQSIIVLLGILGFFTPLLGPLDMRMSIYFCPLTILCILTVFNYQKDSSLKLLILGLFIAYRGYSFFIVFLNNKYFAYEHIHNLLLE